MDRRHLRADAWAKSKYTIHQYAFWVVPVVLLIIGFTVGLIMLFEGKNGNEHCSWCHYLNCVPTTRWKCNN